MLIACKSDVIFPYKYPFEINTNGNVMFEINIGNIAMR